MADWGPEGAPDKSGPPRRLLAGALNVLAPLAVVTDDLPASRSRRPRRSPRHPFHLAWHDGDPLPRPTPSQLPCQTALQMSWMARPSSSSVRPGRRTDHAWPDRSRVTTAGARGRPEIPRGAWKATRRRPGHPLDRNRTPSKKRFIFFKVFSNRFNAHT